MVVFVVLASYFPETMFHNLPDEILNTASTFRNATSSFLAFWFLFSGLGLLP